MNENNRHNDRERAEAQGDAATFFLPVPQHAVNSTDMEAMEASDGLMHVNAKIPVPT